MFSSQAHLRGFGIERGKMVMSRKFRSSAARLALVLCGVFGVHLAYAGEADCGVLQNWRGFGPFDYHDPENLVSTGADPMGRIKRVENVHFNEVIKRLDLKESSLERMTGDIAYTLRVFPNHPEALNAMSRLERLAGGKLPQKGLLTPFTPKISADCFFDRAIRFRPMDKGVYLVYGVHLHQRKAYKEALMAYEKAEALGNDSVSLYYNLGLLHTDMKNWEKAVGYAQKAYRRGAYLPALRERIQKAGYALTVSGAAEEPSPAVPIKSN